MEQIKITGDGLTLNADIERYVERKVQQLGKYLPRKARPAARAEVILRQANDKDSSDKYECEIILHLPERQLVAADATVNMFAAVDIAESKMKGQLLQYKEQHAPQRIGRPGLWQRLKEIAKR